MSQLLPSPEYPNPNYRPNDTAEFRLERTLFIVEATHNEAHELWRRYAQDSRHSYTVKRDQLHRFFCTDSYPDTLVGTMARERALGYLKELDDAVRYFASANEKPLKWEQVSPGWLVRVGEVGDMPVNISVQWNEIDGYLVCFYEAVSAVVDNRMVEKWLKEHFKGKWDSGTRRAECDAGNFHMCLHAIEEAKKKSKEAAT